MTLESLPPSPGLAPFLIEEGGSDPAGAPTEPAAAGGERPPFSSPPSPTTLGGPAVERVLGAAPGGAAGRELVARLLATDGFDRRFAARLVEVARDAGRPWELRRLAAWMLEQQALALDPRRSADRDWLLSTLGLLRGGIAPSHGSAEDATAARSAAPASPAAVFTDLRRRLARLERFHRPFAVRLPPSAAALDDFLDQARREAKLTLARWLFTPEEVADRARALLRVGRGRPAGRDSLQPIARRDGRRALAALPAWDRRFLARLLAGRAVLWSGEATPEEVGALVEAPAGTVVTIVRPPGSDLEIELKRTGRRGARPLGVVFRRDGQKVAAGHRNDGASMTSSLAWEARASAMAGELFRRVHRREAPLPSIVSLRSVETVPAAGGPVPLAAWLDDPAVFGDGFAEMRRAMEESVAAFDAEGAEPEPSGEAEEAPPRPLVERYLAHVAPAQAVLVGTSAFRLDRLDDHLRRDRALADFAPEPPRDRAGRRGRAALRRVADEVLEEALGLYRPPEVEYRDHRRYLAAAFAVPANRARADAVFAELAAEVGTFWGTLLAARAYSWGESFVARNVGVQSVFAGGRWRVRMVFMDHDNLHLPGRRVRRFDPLAVHRAILVDERYVVGWPGTASEEEAELTRLARIYRVGAAAEAAGRRRWRTALRRAYRRTRRAMEADPVVRRLFYVSYLDQVADWEAVAESHLRAVDRGADLDAWRRRTAARLAARGHAPESVERYLEAAETFEGFNRRFRFLTAAEDRPRRRSGGG